MRCEAVITIWGKELSISESMTIRVAIELLAYELEENRLGGDEMGIKISEGYLRNISTIKNLMYRADC